MANKYFAADTADQAVNTLKQKADDWFDTVFEHKYLSKLKNSWNFYHGVYYEEGHQITFGGDQGELVNLPMNHYRNIATHILNMVTANRPSFQARAANVDSQSEIQTELANGLLDYYMRDKRLERYLKKAVEYAIVLGSGYVKVEWNPTSGEIYDYIEPEMKMMENGEEVEQSSYPVYEGDVVFKNMTPFDVVMDSTKESSDDHDWVLCRTFKNKYDMAAKYPEFEAEIKDLTTKDKQQLQITTRVNQAFDKTDDVPVYEFYHRKTEALPNGRYIIYLDEDIILHDSVLPYQNIPIYRIASADILGTPYGYSALFDIIPIQEAINSLYSTILTNQNAFGVQNIISPRGNDVRVSQLEGSMNFIEYNPIPNIANGGKPEPLNLTQTPAEIFKFLEMLQAQMEIISGVNSVARGNVDTGLQSGTALALVQSQALQFMSNLQQSYIQLIEDVGTGLINLLKDFASVPRIATIAGISNKAKIVSFTKKDLSDINRVLVDAGNALSQTVAGKVQMADQLLQMKLIDTPEKYLEVMNTGKLTAATENTTNELILIRSENEALLTGEVEVLAVLTDRHSIHIREHRSVLSDPKLRITNPELIQRTLNHIQEHINILQSADPNILAMMGEQPLSPPGGSPINPNNAAPNMPPEAAMSGDVSQAMNNPQAMALGVGFDEQTLPGAPAGVQVPNMPQPAKAPQVAPDGNPVNPQDIPLQS